MGNGLAEPRTREAINQRRAEELRRQKELEKRIAEQIMHKEPTQMQKRQLDRQVAELISEHILESVPPMESVHHVLSDGSHRLTLGESKLEKGEHLESDGHHNQSFYGQRRDMSLQMAEDQTVEATNALSSGDLSKTTAHIEGRHAWGGRDGETGAKEEVALQESLLVVDPNTMQVGEENRTLGAAIASRVGQILESASTFAYHGDLWKVHAIVEVAEAVKDTVKHLTHSDAERIKDSTERIGKSKVGEGLSLREILADTIQGANQHNALTGESVSLVKVSEQTAEVTEKPRLLKEEEPTYRVMNNLLITHREKERIELVKWMEELFFGKKEQV